MRVTIFIVISLFLVSSASKAQPRLSTKSKKAAEYYFEADNFRVRGQYIQAAELLEAAIKKDKDFHEAYFRLAVIRKAQGDLVTAEKLFNQVIVLNEGNNGPSFFELGELYLRQNNYQQAIDFIDKYLTYNPRNRKRVEEANNIKSNAQFALDNLRTASQFNPRPLSDTVNAFAMQYFPVVSVDGNTLLYTRRLGTTISHDEDLVYCERLPDGRWSEPRSISDNINSQYNEGTCTLSADGRTLIFTSCYGRQGYGSCDLYISQKSGSEWSRPENMGPLVNSSAWDSQPSLSADGRTLYFISNRSGGVGSRDIWISQLDEAGEWTKPVNAGRTINTVREEVSPFIHPNNKVLYYSTNGLPGFGGFDIYYTEMDSLWTKPVNIGAPINNGQDQVSLFITSSGDKGYYSNEDNNSERKGILYEFDLPSVHQVKYKTTWVEGVISDANTKEPLKATIELHDLSEDKLVSKVNSDAVTGEYLIVLTEGSEYALYIEKPNYLFNSDTFIYSKGSNPKPIIKEIPLEPIQMGSNTRLSNIFFKTDEFRLEEKSKTEIKKVADFLKSNPSIKIQIQGHTDDVGNKDYNQDLSNKRAKSVYDYLLKLSINPNRLDYQGYGDNQPLLPNSNEQNRQQNRRIEFKIVKI